jgi:hypothetical protein
MMSIRIQEVDGSNIGPVEGHLKVEVLLFYMHV